MKQNEKKLRDSMRTKASTHWKVPFNEDESISSITDTLKIIGWDKYYTNLWTGIKEILSCEKAYEASQRAKFLNFHDLASDQELLEEDLHKSSIKYFEKARKDFDNVNRNIDLKARQKFNEFSQHEGFDKFREKTFEYIKIALVKSEFDTPTSREVLDFVDENIEIIKKKGFDGFIENADKKLEELIKIRSDKGKNRGREHRSPLKWWKYLALVGLFTALGGIIYAMIQTGIGFWDIFGMITGVIEVLITHYNPFDLPSAAFGAAEVLLDNAAKETLLMRGIKITGGFIFGYAFNQCFRTIVVLIVTGC